jgi:predicted amidohydrolase
MKKMIYKKIHTGPTVFGILFGALLLSSVIINGQERSQVANNSASFSEDTSFNTLCVAAVQMHSSHDLKENTKSICRHLLECAQKGARVAVFPECVTTGYFKEDIPNYSEKDFLNAEQEIAEICRENNIYAVIGTPYFENGKCYNMALVINDKGQTIYRQAKIYLVGGDKPWAQPGNKLGIFKIDDKKCSLLICHDSRSPEMIRLPVLKGSRLVFYISSESNITYEVKTEPNRAQVVARAVENQVYVVQANTPQKVDPLEGSHGQSRIVDPDGTIIQEASIFREEILIETLDINRASGSFANENLRAPSFLKGWWEAGLELVEDSQ